MEWKVINRINEKEPAPNIAHVVHALPDGRARRMRGPLVASPMKNNNLLTNS